MGQWLKAGDLATQQPVSDRFLPVAQQAFDHGGASESIIHEKTGWLAKPNDVGDLSNCINTALSLSASQRRVLARDTRSHITRSFSTAKMCRDTIKIYARLLAKAAMRR